MDYTSMKTKADREWNFLENLPQPLVQIGMGTCGKAAGAGAVLAAVKRTFKKTHYLGRVMEVGCIGLCYLEPLMAVRKPGRPFIYYGNLNPEKAEEILSRYILEDDPSPRLAACTLGNGSIEGIPRFHELPMIRPQVRIALRNCGLIDPENIDHYIARGGYSGLRRALEMPPEEVIREIKASGLRGRGGAGFPTGLKWEFAAKTQSKTRYIVCNADEGDPGAFMDRSLLEGDPHAVLEGLLIGAYAIGSAEGYIYARAEYPLAIQRVETALKQMNTYGLLGKGILGSRFQFQVQIKQGAGAFVCGEETALMASIMGERGMPRPRPPFPAQRGLWDKPTNINNVETWVNVPRIMARGADWFASIGTERSKGTKVFALTGKVRNTGLAEVPMGVSIRDIVFEIGGGIQNDRKYKAVQIGGPSGGCIPWSLIDTPVDYDSLVKAGAMMGSGGMVVVDDTTCMVDLARFFMHFVQSESCGKCTPCRVGTRLMLECLERICAGEGKPGDIDWLIEMGHRVKSHSLCGLGQTAPNPVLTTIQYFRDEYEAHVDHRVCPAGACTALSCYQIIPEACTGCTRCVRVCPVNAISGEVRKPHVIDALKCTACGACSEVCRFNAIERGSKYRKDEVAV